MGRLSWWLGCAFSSQRQGQDGLKGGFLTDAAADTGVVGELGLMEQVLPKVGSLVTGHNRATGANYQVGVTVVVAHSASPAPAGPG